MPNYRGALGGAAAGASAGAALGPYGMAGGAAIGGFAGLMGDDGSADEARKRALIEQALAQLAGVNPEAGASDFASNADFNNAMALYKQRATEGGMTGADRLAQEQSMNDAAAAANMRDQGIIQGLATRGQAGGGSELAARLMNSQGATSAQHQAGAVQAGEAQRRALASLQGWGQMAGQQAGAKDAISEFNANARLQKAGMYGTLAMGGAGVYGQDAQRQRQTSAGTMMGLGDIGAAGADRYARWRRQQDAPGYAGTAGAP